ncbi:MAG: glucosamine-phosphate N-acetyltransferase [Alphaproteobacteria bacterium]|jgi:glucosamine-phosphate N-acetyltransferase
MNIRNALPADLADITPLLAELLQTRFTTPDDYKDSFERLLDGDRGTVLVAEEEDVILGVITVSYVLALRYRGDYAQIEELVVDSRARGRKLGVSLVDAAIAAARDAHCGEIGLYAREHNQPFYERLGFEYVGPELRLKLT